ncbi:MAG: hypothetical protein ACREIJ_00320 [Nitrospiraceae bacterium]
MELTRVWIEQAPACADRVRLCGQVAYDRQSIKPEVYWFDVSEKYAEYLSQSVNPWLACLLPLAVTLGEPLRICAPVDRILFENVHELMHIWKCWYPNLHVIPVEAETIENNREEAPAKTAAFFSGGVDSFFTVLRHDNGSEFPRKSHVDELLCVWGLDVPLNNAEAFKRLKEVLSRAASDLGKVLVDVATNIRETEWRRTDWAHLSYNCALTSVALTLEPRYRQVLIASSNDYRELSPWGSHVLTDPLLSTKSLRIVHDGPAYSRLSKTEYVAKSEVALRSLRVCWRLGNDENCRACEKCYRTMLTLELLGALDRCITFQGATVDPKVVRSIYIPSDEQNTYRDLHALALRIGKRDVAKAIDRGLRNSARLRRWLDVVRSLRTKRFVWRWAQPLEYALLARYVT